ncbi:MAG: hypothetical protein RJB66_715 [Pseudomonadota bacterium]
MQEDFKNQLQNTLGLWKQMGHAAFDGLLKEAKQGFQAKLSKQGVADRWPALINLIQEIAPDLAPAAASIIGRRLEPLSEWLDTSVKNWEPYKIELLVSPQVHLQDSTSWTTPSLVAMAEVAGRWLLEKHCPPGDLKIKVAKLELETVAASLSHCIVRCELNAPEFEASMAELLKEKRGEIYLSSMISSSNDVLLSQVHFTFELQWSPLLK